MTCGHLSFVCEPENYIKAIRGFLETIVSYNQIAARSQSAKIN